MWTIFQMERLTAEVQSVFRELVIQGDWLSSETKGLAESKIQNIVHRFGQLTHFSLSFHIPAEMNPRGYY